MGKKKFFAPSSWDASWGATPRENSSWKKQKRSEAVYVYTDESSVASLVQKQRSCYWVVLPPLLLSYSGQLRVVREARSSVGWIVRLEAYFLTTGRRLRTTTTVSRAFAFWLRGYWSWVFFRLRCGGPSHSVAAGQRGNTHRSVRGFSVCWGHCLRMYVVI